MVALGQIAGLGIRDKLIRHLAWLGTSLIAAGLAAASLAAGIVPYLLLLTFAFCRLKMSR